MAGRSTFGSVRRLPSGRWQASYWHEGRRYTAPATFEKKGAREATDPATAVGWLAKQQAAIGGGQWVDPGAGEVPLSQVVKHWQAATPNKRPSSRARDTSIITEHIEPALGDRPIRRITKADMQRVVNKWTVTHSPSSVARMFATLRAVMTWACDSELIVRNPCRGIRLPQVGAVERPDLDPRDLEHLALELGGDATFMWCAVCLGLRWGEVAGLTVGSLDLLNGTVTISHQLDRAGELAPPKSEAGKRTMAAPSWLRDDLAALLADRGLSAADNSALVFANADDSPLHYSNWRTRTWVPACQRAGLDGLHFHDLKALSASALVAKGVDVKTAQHRLGHSSPGVTLRTYARATREADRSAADALGAYFRPSRTDAHGGQFSMPRTDRARNGSRRGISRGEKGV